MDAPAAPQFQPAIVGFGAISGAEPIAAPGRGLLNAIMRRVRGL
jgi:hypothetical protein